MNIEQVFKRFFADWQKFLMMGLGPLIINLGVFMIGAILLLILAGPAVFALIQAGAMGLEPSPGAIVGLIGSFLGIFVIMMVLGVVAHGLTSAGIIGSVAGYRRGEEVSLSSFWSYATRYFGKMILLSLLLVAVMAVSLVMLIIPVLGWFAFPVWVSTAAVVLGIYPAYLVISQGYGVGDAFGIGFRILTSQFGEAALSA